MTYDNLSDYNDRGIVKWQGFFLSEHTAEIEKFTKEEYKFNEAKELMSEQEVSRIIEQALLRKLPVRVQINAVDLNGSYADDVVGHIRGYSEDGIHIGAEIVPFESIRNIKLEDVVKWSTL